MENIKTLDELITLITIKTPNNVRAIHLTKEWMETKSTEFNELPEFSFTKDQRAFSDNEASWDLEAFIGSTYSDENLTISGYDLALTATMTIEVLKQ